MNELRPYQLEDVERIMQRDTLGVFNEQRTGKTPTSLVAIHLKSQGRIVVVATASMLYKWAEEARQWTPRNVYIYDGSPKRRDVIFRCYAGDPTGILVISYGLFKSTKKYTGLRDKILATHPKGLIVDEAHRAVGRKTENFKALRYLNSIPHRLYLTGTPAPNHPAQVWSLLAMIEPQTFTSYWRFVERYFQVEDERLPYHIAQKAGVSTRKAVGDFIPEKRDDYVGLLNHYSIMRKRSEVMPWLPEQEAPTRIKLPLTPAQTKYLKELSTYYETEHVITQGTLDQLLRLRQVCLAPRLLGLKGTSPKLDWLGEYLRDYPERSVVVFSRFTQFLTMAEQELGGGVGVISGNVSPSDRNVLIKQFQEGMLKVLLIQIDAGKEGITLDNADTLVFTDTYPPASDILQARDRIVATSPERVKPTEIIELMMADSYDEVLYDLVEQRISLTDVANNYINYLKGVE